jgi:hypothetical protein
MIDAGAIKEIERLARAGQERKDVLLRLPVLDIDGAPTDNEMDYSTIPLHPIPRELPEPEVLTVHTLDSLVAYINDNVDALTPGDLLVHVALPEKVDLLGALVGFEHQRFHYISAVCRPALNYTAERVDRDDINKFRLGHYMAIETMIIGLRTLFVQDENTAAAIELVGNITAQAELTTEDDGISQKVTASAGIVRKVQREIPKEIVLRPYRTFRELPEQPSSTFLLRLRWSSVPGERPQAALFDASGGEWVLQAIESIKEYIGPKIEATGVTIIG